MVIVEGWPELLELVPADYQVECGARLNANGGDRKTDQIDNITLKERGTSKSYMLKKGVMGAILNWKTHGTGRGRYFLSGAKFEFDFLYCRRIFELESCGMV